MCMSIALKNALPHPTSHSHKIICSLGLNYGMALATMTEWLEHSPVH